MGTILKYFRETIDGRKTDIAILPRLFTPKGMMPIVLDEGFPKNIVILKDNYAEIDPKAYMLIYKGDSKKIQGFFTMGFNVKGKECMKRATDDLHILGATFFVKPVKQPKTDSIMTFLYIPITTEPSIVKELVDIVLTLSWCAGVVSYVGGLMLGTYGIPP